MAPGPLLDPFEVRFWVTFLTLLTLLRLFWLGQASDRVRAGVFGDGRKSAEEVWVRPGPFLVQIWSVWVSLGSFWLGVGSGPRSGLAVRWSTLGSEAGLLIFRGQIL